MFCPTFSDGRPPEKTGTSELVGGALSSGRVQHRLGRDPLPAGQVDDGAFVQNELDGSIQIGPANFSQASRVMVCAIAGGGDWTFGALVVTEGLSVLCALNPTKMISIRSVSEFFRM